MLCQRHAPSADAAIIGVTAPECQLSFGNPGKFVSQAPAAAPASADVACARDICTAVIRVLDPGTGAPDTPVIIRAPTLSPLSRAFRNADVVPPDGGGFAVCSTSRADARGVAVRCGGGAGGRAPAGVGGGSRDDSMEGGAAIPAAAAWLTCATRRLRQSGWNGTQGPCDPCAASA